MAELRVPTLLLSGIFFSVQNIRWSQYRFYNIDILIFQQSYFSFVFRIWSDDVYIDWSQYISHKNGK